MKSLHLSIVLVVLAAAMSACSDPDVRVPVRFEQQDAAAITPDRVAECDQAPDGTSCGADAGADAGAKLHCIFGACVLNVCGDGVKAEAEQCDDGDSDNADNCNARCQLPACGNGIVDGRDQCDDGNKAEDDGCSSTCRLDSSELDASVPDATAADADAGTPLDATLGAPDATPADATLPDATLADATLHDATLPDATVGTPDASVSACRKCVTAADSQCRDWLGIANYVQLCLENADPLVRQQCADAYECSMRATDRCVYNAAGASACFCGNAELETTCFTTGPKGRCIAEWYAATRCQVGDFKCVEAKFVDPERPSYAATFLAQCATSVDGCGAVCNEPTTN